MSGKKIKTRIAPSPTGFFQVGNLRTSLFDYAFAKKHNGVFIIRIEDTDRERFIEGAIDKVLDLHEYLGLRWDEGPRVGGPNKPYIQSQRLNIYKKYAQELIEKGHAYYCFCSMKRLQKLKDEQRALGVSATRYDKKCLSLSQQDIKKKLAAGEKYVIRLNVPPGETVTWKDEVYGEISVSTDDVDDQVLIKSDGFPTYHFAVVIDDYLMEVSHILRGNDWLPSTPKHVLLYKYFGWNLPVYIHLPNLKEKGSSKKISKRFGAVAAEDFLKEGYLPKALLNFLMFLGWNPGTEKEIFTLEEFIQEFSVEGIQKTDLVSFDREKLLWMNGVYIRNFSDKELFSEVKKWAENFGISLNTGNFDDLYIMKVLGLIKERMKILSEFNGLSSYFFSEPEIDVNLLTKFAEAESLDEKVSRTAEILKSFLVVFRSIETKNWDSSNLDRICHEKLSEFDFKPKESFMTLRFSVTGKSASPPLFDVLELLGKDTVVARITKAIQKLS